VSTQIVLRLCCSTLALLLLLLLLLATTAISASAVAYCTFILLIELTYVTLYTILEHYTTLRITATWSCYQG
jgi:hypothetical protein